jgi:DNA-binding transcriptional MerR regulator
MGVELSIGDLARLTGLPVKTIRYYSDIGLVPEVGRTASAYRRYDDAGLARLELVRTLRELGLDLATIRRVTDRTTTIEEVAGAHADAIDLHIRQLTLRRGALRAIARGASQPEEVQRMTAFARASADEGRRIMEEFLDSVFAGSEDNPFAARMRGALPSLPDEPSDAQVDAWMELAGLVGDPEFRGRVRTMIIESERQRVASGISDTDKATQVAGGAVVEKAGAAAVAGIAPDSEEAKPIVVELVALFAMAAKREDNPEYRAELAAQLETFGDRRVERYWQLIGIINGWPSRPSMMPAYEWFGEGLRAQR